MSNIGDIAQKFIDQSRGKDRHRSRRKGISLRRRQQVIFEETNPALKAAGGSTDKPTGKIRHFGREEKAKTVRSLINKGILSGDAALSALSLVKHPKKVAKLTKGILGGS